jgi:hypothetical protein
MKRIQSLQLSSGLGHRKIRNARGEEKEINQSGLLVAQRASKEEEQKSKKDLLYEEPMIRRREIVERIVIMAIF